MWSTVALTALAMVAFAANSVLCRLALAERDLDAASFTLLRIGSGAAVLIAIVLARRRAGWRGGSWRSAAMLSIYAFGFSIAYLELSAGTGALILFAAVQATMIGAGIVRGERPRPLAWTGVAWALAGTVLLVLPGLTAPAPVGALLMAAAGVGWGVYSLRGRAVVDPIAATAGNFARAAVLAVPIAAALWLRSGGAGPASPRGIAAGLVSGAITSGLGYVIWYAALRHLRATQAAIVQLTVPPIAALGGIAFLGESLSARLAVASASILGGVALVFRDRGRRPAGRDGDA